MNNDIFARNTRATLSLSFNNTYHLPNSDKYLLDFSHIPSPENPTAPFPPDTLTARSAITSNLFFLTLFEFQNPIG
jgi:hypothetical protein